MGSDPVWVLLRVRYTLEGIAHQLDGFDASVRADLEGAKFAHFPGFVFDEECIQVPVRHFEILLRHAQHQAAPGGFDQNVTIDTAAVACRGRPSGAGWFCCS